MFQYPFQHPFEAAVRDPWPDHGEVVPFDRLPDTGELVRLTKQKYGSPSRRKTLRVVRRPISMKPPTVGKPCRPLKTTTDTIGVRFAELPNTLKKILHSHGNNPRGVQLPLTSSNVRQTEDGLYTVSMMQPSGKHVLLGCVRDVRVAKLLHTAASIDDRLCSDDLAATEWLKRMLNCGKEEILKWFQHVDVEAICPLG